MDHAQGSATPRQRAQAFSIPFSGGGGFGGGPSSARGAAKQPAGKKGPFKFLKKDEGHLACLTPSGGSGGDHDDSQYSAPRTHYRAESRSLREAIANDMRRGRVADPFADAVVAVPKRAPPPSSSLSSQQRSTDTTAAAASKSAGHPASDGAAKKQTPKARPHWNDSVEYAAENPAAGTAPGRGGASRPSSRGDDDEPREVGTRASRQQSHAIVNSDEDHREESRHTQQVQQHGATRGAFGRRRFDDDDESSEEAAAQPTTHQRTQSARDTTRMRRDAPVSASTRNTSVLDENDHDDHGYDDEDDEDDRQGNRYARPGERSSAHRRQEISPARNDKAHSDSSHALVTVDMQPRREGRRMHMWEQDKEYGGAAHPTSSARRGQQAARTPRDDFDYRDADDYAPPSQQRRGAAPRTRQAAAEPTMAETELMEQMEDEVRRAREERTHYMQMKQHLERDRRELDQRLREAEQQLLADREDWDRTVAEERKAIRQERRAAEEKSKLLSQQLERERESRSALERENDTLRQQSDKLSSQLRELAKQHKVEVDRLRAEMTALSNRNAELLQMTREQQMRELEALQQESRSAASATSASTARRASGQQSHQATPRGGSRALSTHSDPSNLSPPSDQDDGEALHKQRFHNTPQYGRGRSARAETPESRSVSAESGGSDTAGMQRESQRQQHRAAESSSARRSSSVEDEAEESEAARRVRLARERRAREVEDRLRAEEEERQKRARQREQELDRRRQAEEEKQRQREEEEAAEELRRQREEDVRRRRTQDKTAASSPASAAPQLLNFRQPPQLSSNRAPNRLDDTTAGTASRLALSSTQPPARRTIPTVASFTGDNEPMPDEDSPNDHIVSQTPTTAAQGAAGTSGKREILYRSGKKEVFYSNGTRKVVLKTGHVVLYFTNGDVKRTFPSGKSTYWYAAAQTTHTQQPDGVQVFEFHSSGQAERHFPDGTKEVLYPDGIFKVIAADGSEETYSSDGKLLSGSM